MKKQDIIPVEKIAEIAEHQQSKPIQLSLFELLGVDNNRYSSTIELYDFMPKYVYGKQERINGEFLRPLEREFHCRGVRYKLRLTPACIEDKNGRSKYYYPSQREELMEDALRRLAVEGKGQFLNDRVNVTFSLYQLQKELKHLGYTYSYDEIKDSLSICLGTTIEITAMDGKTVLKTHIFDAVGLRTFDDWKENGKGIESLVSFNIMVTGQVMKQHYRRINLEIAWSYDRVISRLLYKRISHHFTQAGLGEKYHLMLTTLIEDFGLTRYDELPKNLRDVKTAIEKEMVWTGKETDKAELNRKILLSCDFDLRYSKKGRKKLEDVCITLSTTPRFNSEMREANAKYSEITKKLQIPPAMQLPPKQ